MSFGHTSQVQQTTAGKRIKCEYCEGHYRIARPQRNRGYTNLMAVPYRDGEYYVKVQRCDGSFRHLNLLYWSRDRPKEFKTEARNLASSFRAEAPPKVP